MIDKIMQELGSRGLGIGLGMIVGVVVTAIVARWRRHRDRRSVQRGDARDSLVIEHHLVEVADGRPTTLRIRSLGQGDTRRVVVNRHLMTALSRRTGRVTPENTLISMSGVDGSYLLETLANFVCDRVANGPFGHDIYVMAPCCEPAALAQFQLVTVLLIRVADLEMFADWENCRQVEVEHGRDGMRVLTLLQLARRYQAERAEIVALRAARKPSQYTETMFTLDLALDHRAADVPTKPVPWKRFASVLQTLNLMPSAGPI